MRKREAQSPSFTRDQYTATGRAPAEYGGRQTEAWWLDKGPEMVNAWVKWRRETEWHIWEPVQGVPGIELEINFRLPNGVPVKTFIDRVFVTQPGEPVIVDIKSGRIPETPEQLGLYACAIEVQYGVRINWGYFWSPSKGHGTPQDLSMYTADYFTDLSNGVIAGVEAGCFLAKPANGCARWCGVAKNCPAVGGTLPKK